MHIVIHYNTIRSIGTCLLGQNNQLGKSSKWFFLLKNLKVPIRWKKKIYKKYRVYSLVRFLLYLMDDG